jgi:predicted esterase
LHISGGEKLNAALTEGGMIGELQVFHGGHELPQEVLSGASAYLKKQLT